MSRICVDARKLADFGIGYYVSRLLMGLAQTDTSHDFLVLARPPDHDFVRGLGARFRPIRATAAEYSLAEQLALAVKVHRLQPDLYHAPHYVLPASLPCPSVVTVHDLIHLLYPRFLPNRAAAIYAGWMIDRALRRSERVIAVSESTRRDLVQRCPDRADGLRVIYNGVDERFRAASRGGPHAAGANELRAGDSSARPYVLNVGNPKPHKNLDNLLRAWRLAVDRLEGGIELVCVGAKTDTPSSLIRLRGKLGLEDSVRFVGHVDDEALVDLYAGAVALVHPSLYEGFGLPVVEAMAAGTPVITSRGSSLEEIAGDAAILVNPLDLRELADRMVEITTDPARRAKLTELGRARSKAFSWPKTTQQTLAIYDEILSRSSAPTA